MSSLRNIAFASGIEILTDGDLAVRLMAGSALANRRSAPRSLILAPFARLRLGAPLEARGLLEQATPVYRQAVELAGSREEPLARWMLARLLIREGKYEEALIELEAALKRDPAQKPSQDSTTFQVPDPRARALTDRKLWRQALREWEAVLKKLKR